MEIINLPAECCYVCDKHFKTYKRTKLDESVGMIELDIITTHTSCRKLMKKRDKLVNELLEIEYTIFMKKIKD
jgi:hypothetical protein